MREGRERGREEERYVKVGSKNRDGEIGRERKWVGEKDGGKDRKTKQEERVYKERNHERKKEWMKEIDKESKQEE